MSQTETLMLVALGFAAASFLALVIGRGLWGLARRINRHRLDREVPAVIASLKADRDRLRAEQAMQSRKFDVRIEELKARLATQTAEISRHRNRLELLALESRKREAALAEREDEARGMREQLGPLEAELAKRTVTIQTLEQVAHEKDETIVKLNREVAGLKEIIAERDRELAELDELVDAEPPPLALSPEILTAQERLARRIDDLTTLSQEIASQREQFAQERDRFSALRQAIALPAPPPVEDALALKGPRQQIDAIDEQGRAIEEKLAAAERESEALAAELRSLDEVWALEVEELDSAAEMIAPSAAAAANENSEETAEPALAAVPEEAAPQQRAAGNVVSLAARIKALQRDAPC
jgi:chromosome segregation ATPase